MTTEPQPLAATWQLGLGNEAGEETWRREAADTDRCSLRFNDTRVTGAGSARKVFVGRSMDGPASPAADCISCGYGWRSSSSASSLNSRMRLLVKRASTSAQPLGAER